MRPTHLACIFILGTTTSIAPSCCAQSYGYTPAAAATPAAASISPLTTASPAPPTTSTALPTTTTQASISTTSGLTSEALYQKLLGDMFLTRLAVENEAVKQSNTTSCNSYNPFFCLASKYISRGSLYAQLASTGTENINSTFCTTFLSVAANIYLDAIAHSNDTITAYPAGQPLQGEQLLQQDIKLFGQAVVAAQKAAKDNENTPNPGKYLTMLLKQVKDIQDLVSAGTSNASGANCLSVLSAAVLDVATNQAIVNPPTTTTSRRPYY